MLSSRHYRPRPLFGWFGCLSGPGAWKSILSFGGGRLTFWKLALAFVGTFSWCARIQPATEESQGKIGNGVRVWVGPWRGPKFQFRRWP